MYVITNISQGTAFLLQGLKTNNKTIVFEQLLCHCDDDDHDDYQHIKYAALFLRSGGIEVMGVQAVGLGHKCHSDPELEARRQCR